MKREDGGACHVFTTINHIDDPLSRFIFRNRIFIKYGVTYNMGDGGHLSDYRYFNR